MTGPQLLLLLAVATVGVLHTIVPDHWLPIALIARQEGWTRAETARAATGAGLGHSLSTLAIGLVIWFAGAALAGGFADAVTMIAGLALIGFGLWIGIGSMRDLRSGRGGSHRDERADQDDKQLGHRHRHRHADGRVHTHYHWHTPVTWHVTEGGDVLVVPFHEHDHRAAPRRTLLLILGSSPMIEGIPAFLAASRFGFGLIAVMAVIFTLATVVTYVALCVSSSAAAERVHLGRFEQYGEVLSGAFIAIVGLVFLIWVH
ncbi:MAG TPA: hypothetical protein VEP50_06830 [bacterium]|nr:hypothetical protein [bacterium]